MTQLREQLQQQVDNWAVIGHPAIMERFVLRNGTERRGTPTPPSVTKTFRVRGECFKNSALLAARMGLEVEEGYAWNLDYAILPIHHSWVLDSDENRIIDSTWTDPEKCEYMGVHIPEMDLLEAQSEFRVYGILDPGRGINVSYIFKRDPELKGIVEGIIGRKLSV